MEVKENLINESEQQIVDNSVDYISALNEMKKNSVPRAEYEKLREDNKRMLNAFVSGQEVQQEPSAPKLSVNELRKKLFNKDSQLTNLEYVKTALELRTSLIESGERDPFLPYGEKINVSAEHYDQAENVANILQECVEFADGDSGIFTAELQRRTKEVMPRYRGK